MQQLSDIRTWAVAARERRNWNMGKMGKMFVILLFVMTLGFVFLSLKSVARIREQRLSILKLDESVVKMRTSMASLKATLAAAKESVSDLRIERDQLTTERDEAKAAMEKAEAESEKLAGELGKAKTDIQALTAEKDQLEDQVAAEKLKVVEIEKELVPGDSGKVSNAHFSGVTAISFRGKICSKKGLSYKVSRAGSPVGEFKIKDIYRTVVLFDREESGMGVGETIQKGDKITLVK